MDYASEDTRRIGEKMIEKEISNIPNPKVQEIVRENLTNIQNGQRDFRL